MVGEATKPFHLILRIGYKVRFSEDDNGTVVHGVMESGSGEDEAIDQSDSSANVDPSSQGAKRSTGRRSMNINLIARTSVSGRDHKGLTVNDEAKVADITLIEDGVNLLEVVDCPLGVTAHLRMTCGSDCLHNDFKSSE